MTRIAKEKVTENVQVNFNRSPEITYWAKKYNVEPAYFQHVFQQNGNSVSKTLAVILSK